jgi:hypothetical protein
VVLRLKLELTLCCEVFDGVHAEVYEGEVLGVRVHKNATEGARKEIEEFEG